ncbi:hypothetical protein QAD02_001832 [Eretmocerus hayati]|uniref:Uncharacterized protein n=1 Tax=Eretmocerus hayati TaxID=131215 RepID=A0ACC2NI35_9HYME|nr:hypothetical protein QAD02_001832 [Eretmocerus hayati]
MADGSGETFNEINVEFYSDTEVVSLPISDLTITRENLSAYFEGTVESINYTSDSGQNCGVRIDGDVFKLRPNVLKYQVKLRESATPAQRRTTLNPKKLNSIKEFRQIYLGQAKAKELENQLKKSSTKSKIKNLKVLPSQCGQESSVQIMATSQKSNLKKQSKMGGLDQKRSDGEKIRVLNFGWMHRTNESSKFIVQPAPDGGTKSISFNWDKDYSIEEVKTEAIKAFLTSQTKAYFNNAIVELGPSIKSIVENFDEYGGFKGFVAAMNKKNHRFKLYVKTSFFANYTDAEVNMIIFDEERQFKIHEKEIEDEDSTLEIRGIGSQESETNNNLVPDIIYSEISGAVTPERSFGNSIFTNNVPQSYVSSGVFADLQIMKPMENLSSLPDNDLKAAILDAPIIDVADERCDAPTDVQKKGNICSVENSPPTKKRKVSPTKIFKVPVALPKRGKIADLSDLQPRAVHEFQRSDFELTTLLGCGTFGEVRKGLWDHTDIAVKILKVNQSTIAAVKREVNHLNQLSHPNLVALYGVCLAGPKFHLIMEYVDGANLASILFEPDVGKDYNLNRDLIAHQVTVALAYLHKLLCVHRDIKPGNILVTKTGDKAKLCDLGLAKMKSTLTKDPYNTSRGKEVRQIGTPAYMAPEVFLKQKEADESSDVWSLGCTIVELYTEDHVWDLDVEDSDHELEHNIFGKNRVPDQSCVPDFLQDSLKKCFTYFPPERITAIELLKCFSFLIKLGEDGYVSVILVQQQYLHFARHT